MGIIEFGIIVVEFFNFIVNELIILFDIEKCLEVFVCMFYFVIVFFGGVGIVEEILYILGVLLYFSNEGIFFFFIFVVF